MKTFSNAELAEQDIARMRPAVERYLDALSLASTQFVVSQRGVETMWVAYLACLGTEVGNALHGLRHIYRASAVFEEAVARQMAKRAAEPEAPHHG